MASPRDGKGHRAYRRKAKALRRQGRDCAWCGQPIDYTLPATHAMSFTADHPEAVANGGHLYQQDLAPMHRACNSKKGDSAAPIIRAAQ
jgi:5-methylcytosine-specific restriction endonuclease McrA